jgi:hypothetical protein
VISQLMVLRLLSDGLYVVHNGVILLSYAIRSAAEMLLI